MPDSEKSSDPWTMVKDEFETDDGSLSGVVFEDLGLDSLTTIYDCFRVHGVIATKNAEIFVRAENRSIPIEDVKDPVRGIFEGRCESFHCCYDGVSFGSQTFPTLGLFIDPNAAEIDYRMGDGWNRETVNAFFRFLAHLRSQCVESDVRITSPTAETNLFSRVINSVELGDHESRS